MIVVAKISADLMEKTRKAFLCPHTKLQMMKWRNEIKPNHYAEWNITTGTTTVANWDDWSYTEMARHD
jgi:hypothetical protein